MTIIERVRTIRDGLDAGVSVPEVRGDIDALLADVELCGVGDYAVLSVPEARGEACSLCGGPIHPVRGESGDFWRHAPGLPYCADKHPVPAGPVAP